MKRYGVWLGLGAICVGAMATSSGFGCGARDYDTEKMKLASTGAGAGSGNSSSGDTGGMNGSTSGTGGLGCSNGKLEATEECDDGNTEDGDGCTSCKIDSMCWDCTMAGEKCIPVAANTPCGMDNMQVCTGKGTCEDCVPVDMACDNCKNCGGATCDAHADCASGFCLHKICRSANGSSCNDPVECESNFCSAQTVTCVECKGNNDCKSGKCTDGRCNAASGQPCDDTLIPCGMNNDCVASICKTPNGGDCEFNYQCANSRCFINKCTSCTIDTDCAAMNSSCSMGTCSNVKFPGEAYCINESYCQSGKCEGFPRKCAL